jgi:Ca2+-binding RTX toxin-like protein
VTANTANSDSVGVGNGGGIDVASGTTTIGDTILGGNFDTDAQAPDCFGTVTSSGNNQIGTSTGCTFGPASGDMFGDPMLAPLADNGGRTPTHALLDGSPAIDSGSTSALPTDQRGAPRAGVADIGAYERVLCRGVVVNRIGTGGNDTLLGTDAADGFLLDAGDDTATGGGGADAFCAGEGNDTVSGGAGNDTGSGDAGQDKLLGGGGKDKLTGLGGNDKLLGGGGRDKLTGGTGRDKLLGQGGRDLLLGGGGRDTLRGGPGRDVLKGGPGKDTQKQ